MLEINNALPREAEALYILGNFSHGFRYGLNMYVGTGGTGACAGGTGACAPKTLR